MKEMMKIAVKSILTKMLLVTAVMTPLSLVAWVSEDVPVGNNEKIRYFDITISYEDVKPESTTKILSFKNVIQHFAYGIYQCSQGRHKLRNVYVLSDGKNADKCDIVWKKGAGRANVNNPYITMYNKFDDYDLDADIPTLANVKRAGACLAHEWGHYHYGVLDEYKNENGQEVLTDTLKELSSIYNQAFKENNPDKMAAAAILGLELEYNAGISLMRLPQNYIYDWNDNVWAWEDSAGTEWKFRTKTKEMVKSEEPGENSWRALCFSTSGLIIYRPLYENIFERLNKGVFVDRQEFPRILWDNTDITSHWTCQFIKRKYKTSWEYITSSGYEFSDDFKKFRIYKDSQFQKKSFGEGINCVNVIWNPGTFIVALIDNSGSMDATRIGNAKAAASDLADVVPNGDSFAVYTFNSTVSTIVAPFEMTDEKRAEAKAAIRGITAGGGTAIGTATGTVLQDIKAQLADDHVTGASVFLLSDGESADTLAYASEYKNLGVPIYTFGYGSGTSGDLPKLASQTGGEYYYAPNGAAVRRAFQEASQMFGSRNQGSSGKIGGGGGSGGGSGGAPGSETEAFSKSFYIDSTMSNLRLTVSYPNDTPSVMVVDPTDMQIAAADVTTIGNETTATYEVQAPMQGEWRICGTKRVGAVIDYFYDSAAVVDGYRLSAFSEKMSSAADGKRIYRVTAYLRKEASINAANVSGVLYHDGTEVDNIVFSNPANGTYIAFVMLEDEPKTYSLSVMADNASGKAYETFKDIIYEGCEPPEDRPLGENFQRTTSVTFSDDEMVDGEVIYVSAASGNDSRDGTSWASAKNTIQAAIDAVATNGTIIVTNGTYAPIVTHDKRLTIKSVEGWEKTIIDGGGTTRCADLGESSYQTDSHLIGFKLVNGEAGTESGGGVRGGKLIRCRIEQCHAATGGGALYSILENSVVASNTVETTGGGAQDCSLRGCTVVQNQSKSSESGQGGGIYDCGAINTIIWGNKNGAGSVDNCVEAYVKYSCTTPAQGGDGNIASDPLFTNAANGDFSLKTASPCRDAGHSGFVDDLVDVAGQPRVMGGEVDIGAYETKVLPAAPVNVEASDGLSMQYVSISWDASADAKEYSVWRNDGTENVCLADGLAATYFLDWTATPGVHCQYSVRTINDIGEGDASEADEGWIAVMLPGSVVASDGVSTAAIIVTWKGIADAATYQIWRSEDDNVENAVQIGTSEGVSYSDATAKPGKTYYYWVRPVVDSQEGEFIGPDSGFAELPAPEGISASSDKTDCVLVKWYPSNYAAKYYVYRSTWRWVDEAELIGECTFSLPPSGSGIGLYYATFTDDTAETGVQYYYWVKAVGEDKASRFSEYAQGVRIPAPVTGVVASDGDFKIGVAVTWNAVEGITEYRVYRSEAEESFSSAVYVASTERCAYYDTEILGGTIYRYWIVATTHGTDGNPGDSDTGWSRGSISGNAPYLVIDLSQGPSAERFPCYEMWSSPGLCGWPREYKTDKLVLRKISPGTFTMGSKSSEKGRRSDDFWRNDESSHDVTISNSYYIGIFELTIGQDKRIWNYSETSYSGLDETYPAFYMNYWNARGDLSSSVDWPRSSWVQPLSLMGVLRAKTGIDIIDLPTEAEWEYACRAGTTTAFNDGSNLASSTSTSDANLENLARYKSDGVDSGVASVGSYGANDWGLYDMHGNVAEWCLDWYGQVSLGAKVLRGGGHADEPRDCRSASRYGFQRKELSANNGVRVAIRGIVAEVDTGDPVFLIKDGELIACEPNGNVAITIPSTVRSIGSSAFASCYMLKSVTIPNTVTNIGDAAFRSCGGLGKVSVPDSVLSIGNAAFFGCTGLVEVVIGKGLKTIGGWPALVDSGFEYYDKLGSAFNYCPLLRKFEVSSANEIFKSVDGMLLTKDGRTLIACPEGKSGLANVPNGVQRLESLAFDECYNLTSITLPDSLMSIGEGNWEWLNICDSSKIPGVLLVDGWVVGSGYPEPTGELDLAGARGIGDGAFYGCDELTTVKIPHGVKAIGDYAFGECTRLASVTIPDSVIRIGRRAFNGCHASLYDETSVPGVLLVDGWAIECSDDIHGSLDLSGIRGIGAWAFSMMDVTDVKLPERLKLLDDHVFACASLRSVVIPAGVEYIGDYGLDCFSLRSVTFMGNAPALGKKVFRQIFGANARIVYVSRGSNGWGVTIPGTWNGMKISYIGETPDMIRCNVTFDAVGGNPAKQTLTQIATTAWNVGGLQTPTMSGGVFDGWWTAKAGGERVDLDGVCSLAGDTTLFARWLKVYKATVKEGVVSTDGTEAAASVSAVNGTKLYLEAKNKSDKNMEFVYWSYTPATVDLGEDFNPRDPFAECFMPEANVAFSANYATKPGYVRVYAYEVNGTANGGGEPEGIEWSADGKFWLHANDDQALPVKSGKMTIKFRSSDPRWTVPASATYVVENDSKVLDIDVAATRVSVVECDVEFEQPGASGTVAMTPKNGQALPGKNVVLTAKPGKDTVFAYWLVNGETACCDASFKYAPGLDSTVTAVFRLKSEVQNPVLDARTVVLPENAMVGVAFKAIVPIAAAARPAKFTASKLPPGLKIDGASGQIVGVPTKAGKYSVEITATGGSNGKAKSSITIPISIAELPAWAVGNFEGFVNEGPTSDIYSDTEVGPATMSVSAAGKVSGKCTLSGTNWTFKADSYAIRSEISETLTNFVVDAVVTAGKVSRTLSLDLQEFPSGVASAVSSVGGSFYEAGGDTPVAKCTMIRIPWTDKGDAKAVNVIASYAGAYTYEVNYGATVCPVMFTLAEKGVIKGMVEIPEGAKTRKVTFSSNALPYFDGLITFLAVSSDHKKGYPSIFDTNFIVNHYDEPMDGFAYRNPGVFASSAAFDGAGSGTVTMNPKYGQAAAGKTVTLTAKPAKDSVFVKWVYTNGDGEDVSDYSPTLKLVAGECDIPVTALFAAKENVSKPEPHAAAAPEGGVDVWTHAMVGVAFEGAVLVDDAARPASFTAKNLPAGLKIDKTTGVITGRPTKPFDGIVSVTATSGADGKVSGTVEIPMKVHAIPERLKGAFSGFATDFSEETGNPGWIGLVRGLFTATVADGGSIAVKMTTGFGAVSFKADGWDDVDWDGDRIVCAYATMTGGKGEKLSLSFINGINWDERELDGRVSGGVFDKAELSVLGDRNEFAKVGGKYTHENMSWFADELVGTWDFYVNDWAETWPEVGEPNDDGLVYPYSHNLSTTGKEGASPSVRIVVKGDGTAVVSGEFLGEKISGTIPVIVGWCNDENDAYGVHFWQKLKDGRECYISFDLRSSRESGHVSVGGEAWLRDFR